MLFKDTPKRETELKKIIEWIRTEFFSKETLMYLITGLCSTAINWGITFLLNNAFHLGYWVTSVIAFLSSAVFTFLMNKKYTFKNNDDWKKILPRYACEVLICFLLAYGALKPVFDFILSKLTVLDLGEDGVDTLKGILANCCYIAFNYIGQKFFVFRKDKEE